MNGVLPSLVTLVLLLAVSCLTSLPGVHTADPPVASAEGVLEDGLDEDAAQSKLMEDMTSFLSDRRKWVGPPGAEDNEALEIRNLLASWCGDTYTDSMADAEAKAAEFEKLRAERDARFADWRQSQEDSAAQKQEMTIECQRREETLNGTFALQLSNLEADYEASAEELRSALKSCETKLSRKERVACELEAGATLANCELSRKELQANLTACHKRATVYDTGRFAQLEADSVRHLEAEEQWRKDKARILGQVADCRPAKAQLEARLKAVLADGTIGSLERTVRSLQLLVLALLLLLAAAVAAITFLLFGEGRGGLLGGGSAAAWAIAAPPLRPRLLSSAAARDQLAHFYEKRGGIGVAPILTTPSPDGNIHTAFLLVPVPVSSSRRFSLFGDGGDYHTHFDRALDVVLKTSPKARLVAVLYESGGCAFTHATLDSLRLSADKIAYEAFPKEAEYPRQQDVVVVWVDQQEGLRVSNSEKESELSAMVQEQPWAEYLLARSGRWGTCSMMHKA
eukprot:jgi/Mesen1/973/ME000012S00534